MSLAANELEHEKLRLFDALIWASVGLVCFGMALLLAVVLLVLIVAEPYRPQVVAALAVVFGLACWLALRTARERLRSDGGPFSATRRELARDRATLQAAGSVDALRRPPPPPTTEATPPPP